VHLKKPPALVLPPPGGVRRRPTSAGGGRASPAAADVPGAGLRRAPRAPPRAEQREATQVHGGDLREAGATWLPSDAVAAWAEEEEHYDYRSNSCSTGKACGRYTQMVWRDSKEFGCAIVQCDSGDTLMACHYDPQGNVMGQKPF